MIPNWYEVQIILGWFQLKFWQMVIYQLWFNVNDFLCSYISFWRRLQVNINEIVSVKIIKTGTLFRHPIRLQKYLGLVLHILKFFEKVFISWIIIKQYLMESSDMSGWMKSNPINVSRLIAYRTEKLLLTITDHFHIRKYFNVSFLFMHFFRYVSKVFYMIGYETLYLKRVFDSFSPD